MNNQHEESILLFAVWGTVWHRKWREQDRIWYLQKQSPQPHPTEEIIHLVMYDLVVYDLLYIS